MTHKFVSTLGDLSPAEKRKLLETMYELARRQLATGYDTAGTPVCPADFAITNNARKLLEEWKQ